MTCPRKGKFRETGSRLVAAWSKRWDQELTTNSRTGIVGAVKRHHHRIVVVVIQLGKFSRNWEIHRWTSAMHVNTEEWLSLKHHFSDLSRRATEIRLLRSVIYLPIKNEQNKFWTCSLPSNVQRRLCVFYSPILAIFTTQVIIETHTFSGRKYNFFCYICLSHGGSLSPEHT